jgi:hypothetical protein
MFPFLESLDGALTRPYIPLDRIITSVKLLHSLLDQLLSGYVVSSQTGEVSTTAINDRYHITFVVS